MSDSEVPTNQNAPNIKANPWNPREFWLVILSVMVITTSVSWGGQAFPWLGAWGALLIALVFLFLPIEVLERQKIDVRQFGIWRGDVKCGLRNWLLVSIIILPPYALCFHGWQTTVVASDADFSIRKVLDWPLEFEPQSPYVLPDNGFQSSLRGDTVFLGWRLPSSQSVGFHVLTNHAVRISHQSNGIEHKVVKPAADRLTHKITFTGPTSGQIMLRTEATNLQVNVQSDRKDLDPDKLLDGYGQSIGTNPIDTNRDLWWLFNFVLGQLLLVALPEEVFYRGYVQTRLEQKFPRKNRFMGINVSWKALICTSGIFAIGHILTVPHPARLAVFFPSLLFGWMRSATGSVFSAVLFHATCNLFAHIAFKFYG